MKMSGAAAHPNGSRTVIWSQPAGRLLPDRLFVGSCTLGVGSKYPVALRDANGEFLNGLNTYKLRLPLTAAALGRHRLRHHRRDNGGSRN
jgi:hypothetical protein